MSESKSTTKTPKRGRKPKVASVAAATDITDMDESVVAGEKVKPLLVKISKAEVSALIELIGLDEADPPEKDLARRRSEIKALIKMGKTSGYLTHGEISEHLPAKLVGAETLNTIISVLNDMGVAVYEKTPDCATPSKMQITYGSRSLPSGENVAVSIILPNAGRGTGRGRMKPCLIEEGCLPQPISEMRANRLINLVKEVCVTIPFNYPDQSGICDGGSTDLKIQFGYSVLDTHWFCQCPPGWDSLGKLAYEIDSLFQKMPKPITLRDSMEVGKLVKHHIQQILWYCDVDHDELPSLLDPNYSKKVFGINFAFCIEVDEFERNESNHYWSDVYLTRGKHVRVTNEWSDANRPAFIEYLESKKIKTYSDLG